MLSLLAYADNSDSTQTNFILLLLCVAGIVGVCVLAGLLIVLGKRRAHRHVEQIVTAVIFWGLIAVGSIAYAAMTQLKWAQEHLLELESGYGNPQDIAPPLPWGTWGSLVGVYLLLLWWTLWRKEQAKAVG